MPFNTNIPQTFGAVRSGTGQSMLGPKQAVAIALAMKKKDALDSDDFQAPNLMQALKKKKKGAANGTTG